MFTLLKWFSKKQPKRIAFIDGDQDLPKVLDVYQNHLKGIETHLIRAKQDHHNAPKLLRKEIAGLNKIYLSGFTAGKEIVDKFIAAYIQDAIINGYTEITVVSNDFDFIDIFKMAMILNPEVKNVSFKIIVPKGSGRICEVHDNQIANISIVKL